MVLFHLAAFEAVQKYYYDPLNRIDDATEAINDSQTWRQDFSYDRFGNRNLVEANTTTIPRNCGTSPSLTVCTADRQKYNPSINVQDNRLSTSDGYSFDPAGNTTGDPDDRTFIYDAENKQTEVRDASDNVVGQYFYNGDGQRVKKIVPATGEITIFVYDAGGKLVAEYSTIAAPRTEAKVSYLTNDHLGSPRINTDQTGAVAARHDYHPYGEEIRTLQRTTALGYETDTVRKQFTGYERDDETELDFAQARYYNKNVGRFYSYDPVLISSTRMVNPQIWNSYVYVGNNPLKFIDSIGKELILANQNARNAMNRLLSGVTQAERERIGVDSSGRVTISTPSEMCGPETSPSASFAMIQFAVQSETVVRVSLVGPGDKVSLPNSIIDNDSVGNFTADFDNLYGRAGTAVPRTDGSWDVLIPEGGGAMVANNDDTGKIETTEMTIFNHEIAHPFVMDAIKVENDVRRENALPLRSGSDHLDPNYPITVTGSAPLSPIQIAPAQVQTVITPRPLIPPPPPPRRPDEE